MKLFLIFLGTLFLYDGLKFIFYYLYMKRQQSKIKKLLESQEDVYLGDIKWN